MNSSPVETIDVTSASSDNPVLRVSLWNKEFSGKTFLSFGRGEKELTRVQVFQGYESVLWGIYLIAIHIVDQARLNLGYSVLAEGDHLIDDVIKTLLGCLRGIRILSPENAGQEPVDVFIGCSMPTLIGALPMMSRRGTIVLSCSGGSEQSLNVYSTIHRNGLKIYGASFGDDFLIRIPSLSQRLHGLMVRFGHMAVEFQKQIPKTRSYARL